MKSPKADQAKFIHDLGAFPLTYRVPWVLASIIRGYLRHSPISRGKYFLMRHVLPRLLPPAPLTFTASLPHTGKFVLQYREVLALSILSVGGFETAEIESLYGYAKPSSTVIDAGANIGIFTLPLANAVGANGRVLAFEPHPTTVERLKRNLSLNHVHNVDVYSLALGSFDGSGDLHLADDPAYFSMLQVAEGRSSGNAMSVAVRRLDTIWRDIGSPLVSVMKIDVEGTELSVLQGSRTVISTCRPVLLLEANDPLRFDLLRHSLSEIGYVLAPKEAFMPWNHLFLPVEAGELR